MRPAQNAKRHNRQSKETDMNHTTATRRKPIGQLRFVAGIAIAVSGASLWLAEIGRLIA